MPKRGAVGPSACQEVRERAREKAPGLEVGGHGKGK